MTDLQTAPESLFWYWISERHRIYLKRAAGEPKPWTNDPILRDYKFTNAFRELDRGTVWLRENFLEPHRYDHREGCAWYTCDPEDEQCDCGLGGLIAFNICWYRMFNWWGTGAFLGWQTDWNVEEITKKLEDRLANGHQVFTGAHIVYSPPGFGKIDAIAKVCADLYHVCVAAGALETCCREDRSLQVVFETLKTVHCVGGFLAYEMVSDMRHTRLLEDATDIMTWANPGPGAQRGLRRLERASRPDRNAIESMRTLLTRSYGMGMLPDWVPALEMRDIEHSLCEFDKYCRVKFGEGQPRSRFPGAA
jgi:hypothetical protein